MADGIRSINFSQKGNQNQLIEWAIENRTDDPTTPVAGQFWFRTDTEEFKFFDGTQVQVIAKLGDIPAGGLVFVDGYNATTDALLGDPTTGLDGRNAGTQDNPAAGSVYVVDNDGTFYGEAVTSGDTLIKRTANNAALSDWIIIQANVVDASETVKGVIRIATQAETDAGVSDLIAVTPLKLATTLQNQGYVRGFLSQANNGFNSAGKVNVVVTHNLNQRPVHVTVMNDSNNEVEDFDLTFTGVNTVQIEKQGGPAIAAVSIAITQ